MRENLERSRGVVFSGTVLLELAKTGVSREQAYEWVQRNAHARPFDERRDFKTLLLADPDVSPGVCRARTSSARSISTSSSSTSTTSSTACLFLRQTPAIQGTRGRGVGTGVAGSA